MSWSGRLAQTLRQLEIRVTVFEAADCDAASQILQQERSMDLTLLDLGLPGVDGLSYLLTLRRRYPSMHVVILSAFDDARTVARAMKSGAAGFVPKTYSSDRLLEVLRGVLSGKVFAPEHDAVASVALPRAQRSEVRLIRRRLG